MDISRARALRWRSHRIASPAPSVGEAAAHMLAVQGQEFWGGRWALAARTKGDLALSDVDAAFDRGELVRSWTMRGTIHVVPAADLAWVLSVTGERQQRSAAARLRQLGLDADDLRRAESVARAALTGGNRLTRAELFAVLGDAGIDPVGQRGVHVLYDLSMRMLVCQGPVVPRSGGPTREQYVVLAEEWLPHARTPDDPLAELFVRYIDGHGPAGAADFAWWAGLPIGMARTAAEAARDRLTEVEDGVYVAPAMPHRHPTAPDVVALPPFEESFISYADRTIACAPEFLAAVGPGLNGIVRPVLVARGEIVGVWTHSLALKRHTDDPVPQLFARDAATDEEIAAALDRYRAFITA